MSEDLHTPIFWKQQDFRFRSQDDVYTATYPVQDTDTANQFCKGRLTCNNRSVVLKYTLNVDTKRYRSIFFRMLLYILLGGFIVRMEERNHIFENTYIFWEDLSYEWKRETCNFQLRSKPLKRQAELRPHSDRHHCTTTIGRFSITASVVLQVCKFLRSPYLVQTSFDR